LPGIAEGDAWLLIGKNWKYRLIVNSLSKYSRSANIRIVKIAPPGELHDAVTETGAYLS